MKNYIDISTEEKKQEVFKQFLEFNKIGDIYLFYGISDNTAGVKYVKEIAKAIGFDLSYYKEKKKRYCKNCGKELVRGQSKFCSSSCSAVYNNTGRVLKDETKEKIRNKLKKEKAQEVIETNKGHAEPEYVSCENCGKMFVARGTKKYCCQECATIAAHQKRYKNFLEHPEKYNRGNYTPRHLFRDEFLKEQDEKCAICGCGQIHNGMPLVFVLDHIDGNASNNQRENLRMICPNCDSQLPTFKSKNKNSSRRNYWKEKILNSLKQD